MSMARIREPKANALDGIRVVDLWKRDDRTHGMRWFYRVRLKGHVATRAFPVDCAADGDAWALERRSEFLRMTPLELAAIRQASQAKQEAKTKARMSTLIDEYFQASNGGRHKAAESYRKRVESAVRMANQAGIDDLGDPQAEKRTRAFLADLKCADSTRALYATVFKLLSRYAVRCNYLDRDPFSNLRYRLTAERTPAPLTIAEARALVTSTAQLVEDAPDPFWLLMVTALYSGWRLEACRWLKWEDITWEPTDGDPYGTMCATVETAEERAAGKGLKYNPRGVGPGQVAWIAPLQPELREFLREEAARRFGDVPATGYVFSRTIRRMQPQPRRDAYEAIGKRVGVDMTTRTFHDLRHSAVSFLAGTGLDPDLIKRRIGHSERSAVTAHYKSGADQAELRYWPKGEFFLVRPAPKRIASI